MNITIKGIPSFQKRHRHGKGRTWNPSAKEKTAIALQAKAQINEKPYYMPVRVEITAYYPIPKSVSQKNRPFYEGMPKTTKPDVDNISKLYLDALNGIAYNDDNLVSELWVRKLYSIEPCVTIHIEPHEL